MQLRAIAIAISAALLMMHPVVALGGGIECYRGPPYYWCPGDPPLSGGGGGGGGEVEAPDSRSVSTRYNNEGVALANKGDFDGAISKYREALKWWPQNEHAQSNLRLSLKKKLNNEGVSLAGQLKFTEALQKYNQAIALTRSAAEGTAIRRNIAQAKAGLLNAEGVCYSIFMITTEPLRNTKKDFHCLVPRIIRTQSKPWN